MPACRLLPHPDSSNICSGSSENCSANGSMFFTAGASSFTLLLLFHFALLLGLDCLQLGNLFWLVYIAALNAIHGVFAQPETAFQLADLFLVHGDLAVSNGFCAVMKLWSRAIKMTALLYTGGIKLSICSIKIGGTSPPIRPGRGMVQ